jgi:hypothetical protein
LSKIAHLFGTQRLIVAFRRAPTKPEAVYNICNVLVFCGEGFLACCSSSIWEDHPTDVHAWRPSPPPAALGLYSN